MNFHWPFARKPAPLPHVIVRHVVATHDESAAVRKAREGKEAELRSLYSSLSKEQIEAAKMRAVG